MNGRLALATAAVLLTVAVVAAVGSTGPDRHTPMPTITPGTWTATVPAPAVTR